MSGKFITGKIDFLLIIVKDTAMQKAANKQAKH